MSDVLRVVLAGCGGISGGWLRTATGRDDVQVVGLVDLDEGAARKRAEEFGLEGAVIGTAIGPVLDAAGPDIVFDCTVPAAHVTISTEALARGCHVYSEKPLADSMENAHRIVDAAAQAGKLHAVMQNRRYLANIRRLRDVLGRGELGALNTLNSDFYLGPHFGGFRDDMEHVLLLDMAIHTFDAARFLSGADAVSVFCREYNPKGSWFRHGAAAVAVFEMEDGLVYTYRGSWCAEGLGTSWEAGWRVVGERGSATWDGEGDLRAEVAVGPGDFWSQTKEVDVPAPAGTGELEGHAAGIDEFLRCVRTGATPQTVCTDNLKSLAMVFGAVESAETGRVVRLAG